MRLALLKAEARAGVEHKERRAMHGLRKLAAGNVADETGDMRLGMEWIGDRDMKQAPAYLKRRSERMDRAAKAASSGARGRSRDDPKASAKGPEKNDAPVGASLVLNREA